MGTGKDCIERSRTRNKSNAKTGLSYIQNKMGTILYSKNMGLKEDFFGDRTLNGKVIGIIRENPLKVFEQLFGKYKIHSYKSIHNPLNPELIYEPTYGLKIEQFKTRMSSPKLEDITADLKTFKESKKFNEKNLALAMEFMIDNNLQYFVSDGPVYHYMKMRPVANMHVGPGSSKIPKSVHVGPGKGHEETSEPCGIGHTGGSHMENYLLYRDKLDKFNEDLEQKLSEILEITKLTLNIDNVDDLKKFYLKSKKK
jgi:hypothetical protein